MGRAGDEPALSDRGDDDVGSRSMQRGLGLLLASVVPLAACTAEGVPPDTTAHPTVEVGADTAAETPAGTDGCRQPAVSAGPGSAAGQREFTAVRRITVGENSTIEHDLVDARIVPALTFPDDGPAPASPEAVLSALPAALPTESSPGMEQVDELASSLTAGPGTFVIYVNVHSVQNHYEVVCGDVSSIGTLVTWDDPEAGAVACQPPTSPEPTSVAAAAARAYCPTDA